MNHLPVQVRGLHTVAVHDTQTPHPRPGQVEEDGGAETAWREGGREGGREEEEKE
jgi:hypothetical protein